jgi:hypothetical protein
VKSMANDDAPASITTVGAPWPVQMA